MAQQNVLTKVTIALLGVIVSILLAAIPFSIDVQGRIIRIETKLEAMEDTNSILRQLEQRIVRLEERSRRSD